MAIIYKVTSKTTHKSYIGQTKYTLEWRKSTHLSKVRQKEDKFAFHEAIRELGEEDFIWETLEELYNPDPLELQKELNKKERFYIKKYNSYKEGYNSDRGGSGYKSKGFKTLEEKREKKKNRDKDPECKKRRKERRKENRETINLRILNRRHAKLAAMTEEELNQYRKDRNHKAKIRRDSRSQKEKEIYNKKQRNYVHAKLAAMTEEELNQYYNKKREYLYKYRQNIRLDPEKYQFYLEKCRIRNHKKREKKEPTNESKKENQSS